MEPRAARLETDVRGIQTTLGHLGPMVVQIDTLVGTLATKADVVAVGSRIDALAQQVSA